MLNAVDVLIGLSVVMLIGSFAVTLLTQAVTSLVNSRGRHLYRGVTDILQHLDPSLEQKIAEEISTAILKNPMVSGVSSRLGSVISREELTTLLLDLGSGAGNQKVSQPAQAALRAMLQNNGVDDPEQTLSNIRDLVLRLEQSNPELANDVRASMAILHETPSPFVAKINAWFDQTIDRVRLRFTTTTHALTLVLAILTAVVIQIDTIEIANRLYASPALRQQLVESATKLSGDIGSSGAKGAGAPSASPASGSPASIPAGGTEGPTLDSRAVSDVDVILGQSGVFSIPEWRWTHIFGHIPVPTWRSFSFQKLIGVLLSAALLSLGAPFWYEALKTTIGLRSALASTDDAQRLARQTTQAPAPASNETSGGSPRPVPLPQFTEAGNLNAVG
jgi:hypothetical protein